MLSASVGHHGDLETDAVEKLAVPKTHPAPPPADHNHGQAKKLPPPHPVTAKVVTGFIVTVNADAAVKTIRIMLPTAAGTEILTTFRVTAATTIVADGHPTALASLNAGTLVTIQPSAANSLTARVITAINHLDAGTVKSLDAANRILTVARSGGGIAIYSINAHATITVDGKAGPLSAISVGSSVNVTLSVFNNSDIIAITSGESAKAKKPPGKKNK
jgi:hypothetical protein